MNRGPAATAESYPAAWKSLSREKRSELVRDAMRGKPPANRTDAALTLWWVQQQIRMGARPALAVAIAFIVLLVAASWAGTGAPPADFGEFFRTQPLFPIFLLVPFAAWGIRRPKLQRAAQISAGVLTGKPLDSAPDAEHTERLLARAPKPGRSTGGSAKH